MMIKLSKENENMIERIQKMDDREWTIKKKTLIKEIQEGRPLYKKFQKQFLFVRSGFTNVMIPKTVYILQDIQFEIADFEDYNQFFLRVVEPNHLTNRIFIDGTLVWIDAEKGSSQPMSYHVNYAKSVYHVKMSKVGKEKIISEAKAEEMLENKEIFCTISGDLAVKESETVNIFQRS